MNQEVFQLIARDLEIESREDSDFFQILADKVAYMLENQPDLLFSYFYRLDINENQVNRILHNPGDSPVNVQIAKLIVDRQIQRAKTKKAYPAKRDWMEDWESNH